MADKKANSHQRYTYDSAGLCLSFARQCDDDLAFRIGGDEFVILRKHANNIKELEASLLETISKSFLCESIPISMSASVGYASYPEHGQSLNELLLVSDKHMYHHKNSKQGTLEL